MHTTNHFCHCHQPKMSIIPLFYTASRTRAENGVRPKTFSTLLWRAGEDIKGRGTLALISIPKGEKSVRVRTPFSAQKKFPRTTDRKISYLCRIMADNYLERRYDEYLERKAAAEKAKRTAWKKRLDAYRKQMTVDNQSSGCDPSSGR